MVDWSEESALHPGGFRIGRGSQGALPAIAAIPTASAFPARTGRVPPEVLELIKEPGAHFDSVVPAVRRCRRSKLHFFDSNPSECGDHVYQQILSSFSLC